MSDWLERARQKAQDLGYSTTAPAPDGEPKAEAPRAPAKKYDDDLIPQPAPTADPQRREMDDVLGAVDIVSAYNRWCGKMQPNVGARRESIMVSCPNPAHPDANPSAWLNLDLGDGGVGHCATCGGFDKYTIAAWHFGYDAGDYQSKQNFPELRRLMAESLGFKVVTAGKDEWLEGNPTPPPATTSAATEAGSPVDGAQAPAASGDRDAGPNPDAATGAPTEQPAADLPDASDFAELKPIADADGAAVSEVLLAKRLTSVELGWKDLPALQDDDTFLHRWMHLTSQGYEPEEYYFWLGLMAIGAAVGNDVTLYDSPNVRANLMTCLVGSTGAGKSIAIRRFEELVAHALPFQIDNGGGVRFISSPGSGEALIDQFVYTIEDAAGAGTQGPFPVNGIYVEDELATSKAKQQRQGSTIHSTVMSFYDKTGDIATHSRATGHRVARGHFYQAVTSTQPGSLSGLLSNSDATSGYLNRWVYAYGAPKERPALDPINLDVTPLADDLRRIRAWSAKGHVVRFMSSGPAREAWERFYNERLRPIRLDEDARLTSRLDLLCKKLLALLAANDHVEVVTLEHVNTVVQMFDYLEQTFTAVDGAIGVDEVEDCIQVVEAFARFRHDESGESFTVRDLKRTSLARKFRTETIRRAIDGMIAIGSLAPVRSERTEGRGRPSAPRYAWIPDDDAPRLASVTAIR